MKSVGLVLLMLVIAAGVLTAVNLDTSESYFRAYEDVAPNGYVPDGGWIPTFLPSSARDIHDWHDIDTNEGMVSFKFDNGDVSFFEKNCHPVDRSELVPPKATRAEKLEWWFSDSGANSAHYYSCGERAFLMVDTHDGVAYYWILGR